MAKKNRPRKITIAVHESDHTEDSIMPRISTVEDEG